MARKVNPFIVTGKIEPEYFCDRKTESTRLIKSVTNGNNVVVISPRRMGKTGLIQYCYDKPEIADGYYTFFIDILHTSSLRELTYILGREIFDALLPRSKKVVMSFVRTLKSLSGKIGIDAVSGLPTLNIELGDIETPEYTLDEIFSYLANAERPCIVAIDEFQQIAKYPEKNIEALLRKYIQKISNSNFIFAGSERHIMQEMFVSSARPFYNSADILELREIDRDVYTEFVREKFVSHERDISVEDIHFVYDFYKGHTYYIQKAFNGAFADTDKGQTCSLNTIKAVIKEMIAANDTIFREILSNIPEKQKELLYAIAAEGEAQKILSSQFIKRHSLTSASSVQTAVKKLLARDYITEVNKTYTISDKLFGHWLRQLNGNSTVL
jgi:AAA+ ATPase superfamily predicted ATPase